MVRKVIFTYLAAVVAWGLGTVLYEIWMQGHVYSTSRRNITSDASYAANHFGFYVAYGFKLCLALSAVVSLIGLGWMKKDTPPDAQPPGGNSAAAGAGTTSPLPRKLRLLCGGIGCLA